MSNISDKTDDDELLSGLVPMSRREALGLIGGSVALGVGLEGCARQPNEKIVPYVRAPEDIVAGRPLFYASSMIFGGVATGVLVESHMGRPTKIEGNPRHPSSRGGTDIFTQAAVRVFYDTDRSRTVSFGGRISSFESLLEELTPRLNVQRGLRGAGLRVVSGAISSPTLLDQRARFLSEFPQAQWVIHEPVSRENIRAGSKLAFGRELDPIHRFDVARVVLALDSDFLACGPSAVRDSRDFATRRRVRAADRAAKAASMNRLYAVEPALTLTGAKADHRLAVTPSGVLRLIRALAGSLGVSSAAAPAAGGAGDRERAFVAAVAKDLLAHRGESVIVAGEALPPEAHALVMAMNHALGNVNATVSFIEPVELLGTSDELALLAGEMAAGKVDVLVLLQGRNLVYTAPRELELERALSKVPLRIHHGLFEDETSAHCHWHVPESHELESWSDARAHDGTYGIVQPLIAPLYASKTAHEMVATLLGEPRKNSYEIVRERWKRTHPGPEAERLWERALHDGLEEGTAFVSVDPGAPAVPSAFPAEGGGPGLEISIRPDPTIWDGRFANNGWLQELPKPITKITWDNSIWISAKTAERLGVVAGELVNLTAGSRKISGPIAVVPGHADEAVTVFLGYGRTRAGKTGTGAGFDVYPLRSRRELWTVRGGALEKTGAMYALSVTQGGRSMEGRYPVRSLTREEFVAPKFVLPGEKAPPKSLSLYPERSSPDYAWGMSIDLGACTGCSACVVACQAENNIPTVGKAQVAAGREMHWLRVDQYFEGSSDEDLEVYTQPLACVHCETAPCELVCPVGATTHSPEGLNEMTYNRCIGTRYCSHNCPYKVRRFNFLLYSEQSAPTIKMMMNPDVTVRSRGVMEKCSYCVQRINHARIDAKRTGRAIADGEIVTACEAACPSQAIVFGDINDPKTRVSKSKQEPHTYGLLAELNTRPRTTYLATITNPNPELAKPKAADPHHPAADVKPAESSPVPAGEHEKGH